MMWEETSALGFRLRLPLGPLVVGHGPWLLVCRIDLGRARSIEQKDSKSWGSRWMIKMKRIANRMAYKLVNSSLSKVVRWLSMRYGLVHEVCFLG